ncbi:MULTISPECIES: RNA polymerase sigma factor RpoE [unclassified Gilliamella]|uniref:RNA polymerase sigma factor RpoE n=1 Tax=unclassified Gilliamella TaxID=2685620 RepID=UPI00226A0647|nr:MULTISPECIES: RNA polymerase sigma factor RpoE [unclassified Gilliamella]MCX8641603.1 RNA polymerase sigma factor RpoE [Gilliamella sp. B3835]MCX8706818.1 RNA polymerase sigma factor RpoE [Gilliamella sp. B3783]MCX8708676.1 RNA polymerase sigma factor RpoE [Gilliamella sp. B3780]MCX8713792.1 RNA polymerase sigma factor RpoE [Gilliamella sp. B3781]MCX8715578.1 RNA polymerase sigma factor RpoE [Gilliamella sp. B3784]
MGEKVTDQVLVDRVLNGDKNAFNLLVLRYQNKLAHLVSRYVLASEIPDVVQETFIKAYRSLSLFKGESIFYTWLYRIAVNTAKNYLISQGRRPPSSDIDATEAEGYEGADSLRDLDNPESLVLSKEVEKVVFDAIEALPDDLRTAITLREIDGLSYEEIAEIMDTPVGTVRSRIFRARDIIDEKIKPLING